MSGVLLEMYSCS